jgi:hypothetical protein
LLNHDWSIRTIGEAGVKRAHRNKNPRQKGLRLGSSTGNYWAQVGTPPKLLECPATMGGRGDDRVSEFLLVPKLLIRSNALVGLFGRSFKPFSGKRRIPADAESRSSTDAIAFG